LCLAGQPAGWPANPIATRLLLFFSPNPSTRLWHVYDPLTRLWHFFDFFFFIYIYIKK